MRENVGIQDQIECAHGGLNVIEIAPSGDWTVTPVVLSPERMSALESRLMLFYTGMQRTSSEIQAEQIDAMHRNEHTLHLIHRLVTTSTHILLTGNLDDFGSLLHEGWTLKQRLSSKI